MPITPLPTPPSRQDPANFAARGDALLSALPAFVTEANALQAAVNEKEASTLTKAGEAAASAAAALISKNAAATSEANSLAHKNAAAASEANSLAHKNAAADSAGAAAGSASSALAIYGNTAAMQTKLDTAAAQANAAQAAAASAGSVLQQDLSMVSGASLHRSPNAIVAQCIYDTSLDSDGGAWVDRMSHTSWMNEPLNGAWLGQVASEATARALPGAATGDYYQLTTDGKFYALKSGTGTTEVFRGNKAKFPRLAAIVAELPSVTIYDLTEAGRPMWMRFVGLTQAWLATSFMWLNSSSLAMANGKLAVGDSSGVGGGITFIDFLSDSALRLIASTTYGGKHSGNIAKRNLLGSYSSSSLTGYPAITSSAVNAVAMTVLPDAPIDPATGLQIPTIAVGTAGGVSVIRADGTVASITGLKADAIGFATRNSRLWFTDAVSSTVQYGPLAFSGSIAFTAWRQGLYNAGPVWFPPLMVGAAAAGFKAPQGALAAMTTAGFNLLKENPSKAVAGAVAYVTPNYNTGYLVGDTRRCFLANTEVESVGLVPELVTNGTFDAGLMGWSGIGTGGTSAVVGGELEIAASSGVSPGMRQGVPTVIGKTYALTVTGRRGTSPSAGVAAAGIAVSFGAVSETKTLWFTASSTSSNVDLTIGANGTAYFDNISVKEAVPDRSYKAAGANIYGTLTKSAVATAAQLVAYSGFSASNYLQESYSADLDFGTGEWSVGAWVNATGYAPHNLFRQTEDFTGSQWVKSGTGSGSVAIVDSNYGLAPDSTMTATRIRLALNGGTGAGDSSVVGNSMSNAGKQVTRGCYAKLLSGTSAKFAFQHGGVSAQHIVTVTDQWTLLSNTVSDDLNGTSFTLRGNAVSFGCSDSIDMLVWHPQANFGPTLQPYSKNTAATAYVGIAPIIDRSAANGPSVTLGLDGNGCLKATAYDGTTTRTATTANAYNTGTWLKARATYVAGKLGITVNGAEVASTNGLPLLTLNNSNAVLTIGNSRTLDAPFPGSIALLKIGATVPTPEQAAWMYEQEKQMFRDGAQITLPASTAVTDLAYDQSRDRWVALQSGHESSFTGLVRTAVNTPSAGSFAKVSATSGVKLLARTTTSPGVDVTIPAYGLREELVKRGETAAKAAKTLTSFDFDAASFTATTTNASNQLTAVASVVGTPYLGMGISGTGIPAGTTITGINGTTYTLSANATAAGTAVTMGQTDFTLPVGYVAKDVLSAGARKREGTTKDWVRLFDGFRETVRFAVSPGSAAWVQINAAKE